MNNKIYFTFFGNCSDKWDKTYLNLIQNTKDITSTVYYWYIEGKDGKEYRIRDNSINHKGEILDNNENIFTRPRIRRFCEVKEYKKKVEEGVFPGNFNELEQNNIPFRNFIRKFQIKRGSYEKTLWSVNKLLKKRENTFSSFIISNNQVIGYALAEILKEEDIEGDYTAYSTKGYISSVKIREDFQNRNLCTPLVTFLINKLKKEGFEKIFIDNASYTKNGIPACFCYYKSGISNHFNMYYQTSENQRNSKKNEDVKLNKMDSEYCLKPNIRTRYYYISKNIGRTAKKKIKKVTNSIAFLSSIKKTKKKL